MCQLILRPLKSQKEINQARNLLFNVYYLEMGWRPAVDNPSGLHLEIGADGVMLADSFDSEALWFGCFVDGQLVATNRLLNGKNGGFEVEKYTQIPEEFHREASYEINRLAIHKDFRAHASIFLRLIAEQVGYLSAQGTKYLFSTAPVHGVGALYLKTGMKLYDMAPFKYETKDPAEVSFMFYDFAETAALERIELLIRRSERSAQKRA